MIATHSYRRPMAIEPTQHQPSVMDRFDKLVLRAAKYKKKDIINRYGQEGFEKLAAKGKQEEKKEDPELLKNDYESTIRNLLESFDQTPQADSNTTTKSIDKVIPVIESAWRWNLSRSPNPKSKRKRKVRVKLDGHSRRHSLEVSHERIPTNDDICEKEEPEKKEENTKRSKKKKSAQEGAREGSKERRIRRSRKKVTEERLGEEKRINAIEEVERRVSKKKNDRYNRRRATIGSNVEASRKLSSVRQAVRYWEGRGAHRTPQRRLSC